MKQRLKLLRQDILAALYVAGHKPLKIDSSQFPICITVDGHEIYVPSPLRWKLYKYGWKARLDRLESEYGVNRHINLTADDVVIDIGSNAGEFAHVCARYDASVHCIEPDPKVFQCLKRNTQSLTKCKIYNDLIWKENTAIQFGLEPERADSSVFAKSENTISIEATDLQTFCTQHSLNHIDLIKCDAEGAEPEILQGIGDFFPNIHVIALDTGAERSGVRTHDACTALLTGQNFYVVEEKIGTRWMTFGINKRFSK